VANNKLIQHFVLPYKVFVVHYATYGDYNRTGNWPTHTLPIRSFLDIDRLNNNIHFGENIKILEVYQSSISDYIIECNIDKVWYNLIKWSFEID